MAQTKIAGLFLDPTVISGLTALGSGGGAPAADYLFVWDATDSLLKKIIYRIKTAPNQSLIASTR